MNDPCFLSVRDVATRCRISIRSVRRWLSNGLRYRQAQPHSRVLIAVADLEAYLQPRQRGANLDSIIDETLADFDLRPKRNCRGSANCPAVEIKQHKGNDDEQSI